MVIRCFRKITSLGIPVFIAVVLITYYLTRGRIVDTNPGRREELRQKAAKSSLEVFAATLDMFELDNERYPTNEEGLEALLTRPKTVPGLKNWSGPYIEERELNDPWGNRYVYTSPGRDHRGFELKSYGPDGKEGGGDDIAETGEVVPTDIYAVIFGIVVGTDGNITSIRKTKVINASSGSTEPVNVEVTANYITRAKEIIRRKEYEPSLKDGKPVEFYTYFYLDLSNPDSVITEIPKR